MTSEWHKIERIRRRHELAFLRQLYPLMWGDVRRIKSTIRESGPGAALNLLPSLFDPAAIRQVRLDNYNKMGIAEATRTYEYIQAQRKARIDFISPLLIAVIQRLASEYSTGEKVVGVSDTIREDIRTIITAGMEEELSALAISKLLTPTFARDRALRIVRTETTYIFNRAANEGARASGVRVKKRWVSTADARTRDAHRSANGQTVEMDQAFSVGGASMNIPGDPAGGARNVVNCRCAVIYVPESLGV